MSAEATQTQLTNASLRLAILLDGLEAGTADAAALVRIEERVARIYARLPANVGSLSKAKLKQVEADIRRTILAEMERHDKRLLNDLEKAANGVERVVGRAFTGIRNDYLISQGVKKSRLKKSPPAIKGLWAKIKGTPYGDTGELLSTSMKTFQARVLKQYRDALYGAYANKRDRFELSATLDSKHIQRLKHWRNTYVRTATRHVASVVQSEVLGKLFDWYGWVSVLDSATSVICKARNRKRYRYGKGPLPPAHADCRSTIVPLITGGSQLQVNFISWLRNQPAALQNLLLGNGANKFRDGQIGTLLLNPRPLTVNQFVEEGVKWL